MLPRFQACGAAAGGVVTQLLVGVLATGAVAEAAVELFDDVDDEVVVVVVVSFHNGFSIWCFCHKKSKSPNKNKEVFFNLPERGR